MRSEPLIIDPAGGIAGDMFAAALVSLGADAGSVRAAMSAAANKLGAAHISLDKTADGAVQLNIRLDSRRDHLGGREAREILAALFGEFGIKAVYRDFGLKVLDILLEAETMAHAELDIEIKPHSHHHHHQNDGFLHEAQDIVIDIMGAVVGLQLLAVEPCARLLSPAAVGGGMVDFSHGILPVPAPAAQKILDLHRIQWQKGPLDVELATPTGLSILAALGAREADPAALEGKAVTAAGFSRGTKMLDIPPLKVFLLK